MKSKVNFEIVKFENGMYGALLIEETPSREPLFLKDKEIWEKDYEPFHTRHSEDFGMCLFSNKLAVKAAIHSYWRNTHRNFTELDFESDEIR